jgi:hypothetical protein
VRTRAGRLPRHALPAPLHLWISPPPFQVKCESTRLTLDGFSYVIKYWTAEEFARIPKQHRPAMTLPGDAGGWFSIEQDPLA